MNAYYCSLFSSRVVVSFGVWLVSDYAQVFVLLSVVVVPYPVLCCKIPIIQSNDLSCNMQNQLLSPAVSK